MNARSDNTVIGHGEDSSLHHYKSMLSALSDGELPAAELDELLAVLLQDTDMTEQLLAFWQNLQAGRSVLKGEYPGSANKILLESIRSQLSIPELAQQDKVVSIAAKRAEKQDTFSSFGQKAAVAASVMFAVLLGWFGGQAENRQQVLAWFSEDSDKVASSVQMAVTQEIPLQERSSASTRFQQQANIRQVSAGSLNQFSSSTGTREDKRELYLSQDRMGAYLRLHANHTALNANQGMLPFARLHAETESQRF